MSYCTQRDVGAWIPLDSVQPPARLLALVSPSTDTLSLSGHGLELDEPCTLRADAGGAMPGGLTAGTTYYAIPLTADTLKLAAAPGGAAVNITTTGTNVLLVVALPWDSWIEEESQKLECTLPAHAVPLSPVPPIVRSYVSGMVALRALTRAGVQTDLVAQQLEFVRSDLREWRKGIPIAGFATASRSNLAITASASDVDARGWAPLGAGVIR